MLDLHGMEIMQKRSTAIPLILPASLIMILAAVSDANAQACNSCVDSADGSLHSIQLPLTTIGGPGTEMTKMINRIGLGSDCARCKSLAAQMDQGGPNWVRENRQYVVSQTISNA
jgi:hypothetical protein